MIEPSATSLLQRVCNYGIQDLTHITFDAEAARNIIARFVGSFPIDHMLRGSTRCAVEQQVFSYMSSLLHAEVDYRLPRHISVES